MKINWTYVGLAVAGCQFLIVIGYISGSFLFPSVPHPDKWQSAPDVEICEGTNLDEDDIVGVTTTIPGLFVENVRTADLCLCDMGMQPLSGVIQITTGLPPGVAEPVVGLTQRSVQQGKLMSACVYMPDETLIAKKKINESTYEHVLRHELSHAYGYDHAYLLTSETFEESQPKSIHNWGIPAVGQLMTYELGISGTSTKNMH